MQLAKAPKRPMVLFWLVVAVLLAGTTLLAGATMPLAAEQTAVSQKAAPQTTAAQTTAAQTTENSVVYYSGFGIAGINYADPYADYEYVHSLTSDDWPTWSGRKTECSTENTDLFPEGPNVLVGWSIGRVAPAFFLEEAPDRWDEIDTIWLLDPGTLQKMTAGGNCDDDLAKTPSAYFAEWLEGDRTRRLIILSGDLSEEDDRAGLNRFYLGDLVSEAAQNQTLLCRINKGEVSNHDNRLVRFFMPFTTGRAECPDLTVRITIPGQERLPVTIGEAIAESVYNGASGRDGAVVRLYASVFARLPDSSGFNFWTNDSRTLRDMARFFVTSAEFVETYGDLTDDEFVVELYYNVLGRAPDNSGLAYWRNRLATDLERADVVVLFSDSAEFRSQTSTS